MLQFISSEHDPHTLHRASHSAAAVASARADGKAHLLLAVTGCEAAVHVPDAIRALSSSSSSPGSNNNSNKKELSIRVILTRAARRILSAAHHTPAGSSSTPLLGLPGVDAVYADDGAADWGGEGQPALYAELRAWADVLAVAPLSADALGKISNGLADDLLTEVVRAWDTDGAVDGKVKPIILAPAMDATMWRNPITKKQLRVLEEDFGVKNTVGEGEPESGTGAGWFEVLRPQSEEATDGKAVGAAWQDVAKVIGARLGLGN